MFEDPLYRIYQEQIIALISNFTLLEESIEGAELVYNVAPFAIWRITEFSGFNIVPKNKAKWKILNNPELFDKFKQERNFPFYFIAQRDSQTNQLVPYALGNEQWDYVIDTANRPLNVQYNNSLSHAFELAKY